MEDPSAYANLGFEERLGLMVDAEWNRRQANKLTRFVHNAKLSLPNAVVEDIEYFEDRHLDKTQILRLSTCKYIDDGHHIILRGASGDGKTFVACALGNAACRKFKTVRYARMPELLDELSIAKACGEFQKLIAKLRQVDLLILDEWLIRCLTPDEYYNLLKLWRQGHSTALPSFVRSLKLPAGTKELIPTRVMQVRFPKRLLTASFTTHTTY